MTYYKVVFVANDGKFLSSSSSYPIEYKLDEFVYPKIPNSKLFVFNDLNAIMAYYDILNAYGPQKPLQVFSCDVKNPVKEDFMVPAGYHRVLYAKFWNKELDETHKISVPLNTVFVDAVKLTKFVC